MGHSRNGMQPSNPKQPHATRQPVRARGIAVLIAVKPASITTCLAKVFVCIADHLNKRDVAGEGEERRRKKRNVKKKNGDAKKEAEDEGGKRKTAT